ncbi:2-iminoacetate synthase ThiH [Lachnospiraceae bacterium]|nr:2-iminoacetate synthase ThiH [Lachnospiraceae bacterium]
MKDERQKLVNHMEYMEGMEQIDSDIMEKVINARDNYQAEAYTAQDVRRAIEHDKRTIEDFAALLSPAADVFLEEIAGKAKKETERHFGNSVYMFTPIYISNYCENYCIYCGFNCRNQIRRMKLKKTEIEKEMAAIAGTGLEEILILTGESRAQSDVSYIGEACKIARSYFRMVGLEVYPMNTEEYAYLQSCGADYVTVFQETYDSDCYETLHLSGHKRIFPYRFHAQERALRGGMRGVAFAALLGLADFSRDAFATGLHAYYIQRKYPHAEISFSCPRLRPVKTMTESFRGARKEELMGGKEVSERELMKIMCAYRLFMPYAGITVSTRERAEFRNHVIGVAATKISAGVSTGIGSHSEEVKRQGDNQFEIADERNVSQVFQAIKEQGLQPVMNDYVYV